MFLPFNKEMFYLIMYILFPLTKTRKSYTRVSLWPTSRRSFSASSRSVLALAIFFSVGGFSTKYSSNFASAAINFTRTPVN